MNNDSWLTRWQPLIREKAAGKPILEIGCGWGWDTKTLVDAGHAVIGIDQSAEYLERARQLVPTAELYQQNLLDSFVGSPGQFGVIISSLSMHYFTWQQTVELESRLYSYLRPEGLLLFRVNSTNDTNYGATGYAEIEPDYYLVDDHPKRFFDKEALFALFLSGWLPHSIEEQEIDRFEKIKQVWELVLEKSELRSGRSVQQ